MLLNWLCGFFLFNYFDYKQKIIRTLGQMSQTKIGLWLRKKKEEKVKLEKQKIENKIKDEIAKLNLVYSKTSHNHASGIWILT